MQKLLTGMLFSAALVCAQGPDITGIWKADLSQSKIAAPPGPPPSNYLVAIERKQAEFDHRTHEQAPLITETTAIWGEHGQQRSVLTVFDNGRRTVRPYQGIPTRVSARSAGDSLTVTGEVAGRPNTFTRTYKLSPDGKTLTVTISADNNGKKSESRLVLIKQPDSAGDVLRKPEELAGTHFKNVKTDALKDLPTSEFIDQMRYFAWSLNRDCEFCHVAHHFDSDDKAEKRTARKMIEMVAAIDQRHFEGHPEVRCFTCHEGHANPLSHPQFADEAAAEKARMEKERTEREQGGQGHGSGGPTAH